MSRGHQPQKIRGQDIPGKSQCKGPEAGEVLASLKNQQAYEAEAQ